MNTTPPSVWFPKQAHVFPEEIVPLAVGLLSFFTDAFDERYIYRSMNLVDSCGKCIPSLKLTFSPLKMDGSGQIIATSHDLTPHGRVVGEPCLKWPYFREI